MRSKLVEKQQRNDYFNGLMSLIYLAHQLSNLANLAKFKHKILKRKDIIQHIIKQQWYCIILKSNNQNLRWAWHGFNKSWDITYPTLKNKNIIIRYYTENSMPIFLWNRIFTCNVIKILLYRMSCTLYLVAE